MKKYRLKKELPFAKLGDDFYISKMGNLIHTKSGKLFYRKGQLYANPSILTDWFEEIPEGPKTVWDLEYGDKCWIIQGCDVSKDSWTDWLEEYREVGDIFLTKQEAERELARRKAREILKRDTKGFKPDWGDRSQDKWSGEYDHDLKRLECDFWIDTQYPNVIYFASENDIEESFRIHRKEWLTLLGVEE